MAQLRDDYKRIKAMNTEVMVVGPDSLDAFKKYWQKHRLAFVGLPDPTHSVLKLYGQKVNIFRLGRMPAQVLVDRHGLARFVHYGHSMVDIPANDHIIALLGQINVNGHGEV